MFVHIARELEEDIKSSRMREILHIGAIRYLHLWLREQSPVTNFEEMASAMGWDGSIGHQEESASAIGWKELIDLCSLAEIFDFDLAVIPIRVFRFKYRLEMMPDDLMDYIYKRTTEGSAFREAVIEERIFQKKPLKPISYPRAFLLDLNQEQTKYCSSRGYHDDDEEDHEEEHQDGVTMHFQLIDKLKKLRKILNLAKGKGKVNSDIDEETEDKDSEYKETDNEDLEDEETEDEEMEDEEMEDDTEYEKDNKGHEMEVISQQEAEKILKSIAKLITK